MNEESNKKIAKKALEDTFGEGFDFTYVSSPINRQHIDPDDIDNRRFTVNVSKDGDYVGSVVYFPEISGWAST